LSGKAGRAGKISAGSLAVTVVGAVITDLSRPNSLIRKLATVGRDKLVGWRKTGPAIDISKAVEVEIIDEGGPIQGSAKKQEDN